jgi:hypothetical protein
MCLNLMENFVQGSCAKVEKLELLVQQGEVDRPLAGCQVNSSENRSLF